MRYLETRALHVAYSSKVSLSLTAFDFENKEKLYFNR